MRDKRNKFGPEKTN